MLGLFLPRLGLGGPLAIIGGIFAIFAICGCVKCMRCQLRDCFCCKRLLRCLGHDAFDDFDLMILVHEAIYEAKAAKITTAVRVTAGSHTVKTDPSSTGVFQQPVHISVEQGTDEVTVELLDNGDRVLATLSLDVMGQILDDKGYHGDSGTVYAMKQKGKGIGRPKIKLTMVTNTAEDAEEGLLKGLDGDVDILVRQQLKKVKHDGIEHGEGGLSEVDVLKAACAGPVEIFEGLGKTREVYLAALGPPTSKRYVLGIWQSQKDFEEKKNAMQEVDILKIELVQGDPTRHHVFFVKCFDASRVRQTLTLRRVDRARDVWVELLHLLVMKVRDAKKSSRLTVAPKSKKQSVVQCDPRSARKTFH